MELGASTVLNIPMGSQGATFPFPNTSQPYGSDEACNSSSSSPMNSRGSAVESFNMLSRKCTVKALINTYNLYTEVTIS